LRGRLRGRATSLIRDSRGKEMKMRKISQQSERGDLRATAAAANPERNLNAAELYRVGAAGGPVSGGTGSGGGTSGGTN
jgi:hypothetical protein